MSLTPRLDKIQKNYLINADMRIAQRGTSFAAIASAAYSLDRWRYDKVGAMVHTVTQDTSVPTSLQADYLFQNSLRANLTTPDTSIAAGDHCEISQKVEGYNWANLAQKTFTLSFWVRATLVGTYCIAFLNSGTDRSYVAEYTVNVTDTWEYKVITVSASPAAGTWNYTNGIGLDIRWVLAAGTTFQTSANTWQTGAFLATVNQVNGVNTGATDFRLTGVSLVEGEVESPSFSTFGKDFEREVVACQRYYEKSYDLDVAPATVTGTGPYMWTAFRTGSDWQTIVFKVKKRTSPTCIPYSPTSGAANNAHQDDVSAVDKGTSNSSTGMNSFAFFVSGDAGAQSRAHWTADAEL